MRLMFVYWKLENAGSAQTLGHYAEAAKRLGHEVALYAEEDPNYSIPCSLDIESADAVIFLLEWNVYLNNNIPFDLETPVNKTPRERRIVIDNDGMYNDMIKVGGDYNHPTEEDGRRRKALYDSISDKIYQPSPHPQPANVGTCIFHGYDASQEVPLDFSTKEYGMIYIGSNWFRWQAMQRVLKAIEPVRQEVGRIGLIGHNWDAAPYWIEQPLRDDAYYTDAAYLKSLDIELMPAVPIDQVINWMSQGVFNPVLVRPVFNHFRLVNPRLFETPAANTIPLFNLDAEYVQDIYGEAGLELVLGENPWSRIEDVLRRPEYYARIVKAIREHLAHNHSYEVRFQELIEIVKS